MDVYVVLAAGFVAGIAFKWLLAGKKGKKGSCCNCNCSRPANRQD